MNIKLRKGLVLACELLLCILNGVFLFILPDSGIWWLKSYGNIFGLISFIIGGVPVIISSIIELSHKNLTADILFSIALIATLYLEDFFAVSILIIMMGAGDFIEEWTLDRSKGNLESLIELQPEICHKKNGNTDDISTIDVPTKSIVKDDIILVKQGERIAIDGVVINGNANLDQSSITGESMPIFKKPGDSVLSGSLIIDGYLEIECSVPAKESSIEKVINMVINAQNEKSEFQTLTDKWAKFFAPTIILIAIIVWLLTQNLYYSVTVLVVSCPCALVLSVPTAFIASLGNAANHGVWIKSGDSIEKIGKIDTVMLDKTGTLTTGDLIVNRVIENHPSYSSNKIMNLSASLEYYSSHPIAKCLLEKNNMNGLRIDLPADYDIIPGVGISGIIKNQRYYLGNKSLLEMEELNLNHIEKGVNKNLDEFLKIEVDTGDLGLILAIKDEILGFILLRDELRISVVNFVNGLKTLGIKKIGLISGDNEDRSNQVAEELKIDFVRGNLKPEDKFEIIKKEVAQNHHVAMVGDGINDAPSLALATVGIAIGKGGTAIAASQADVILLTDEISNLVHVIDLGRRTIRKSKINIVLALFLNMFGIYLSLIGFLNPISAALWHIIESLIVVINSSFLLKVQPRILKN